MGRKTDDVYSRIEPELKQALEKVADERDRSVSYMVREGIKRIVEDELGTSNQYTLEDVLSS